MNRKEYSTREVEEMLRELARQDRELMDDALSQRLLAELHAEADRVFRRRRYRAVLPWAAVLVGCAVAAGLLLPGKCGWLSWKIRRMGIVGVCRISCTEVSEEVSAV